MITEAQMCAVLNEALATGSDFAELYFEEKDELNIKCANGSIRNITTTRISGVGVYLLLGSKSVYGHTNDLSFHNLIAVAQQLAQLLKNQGNNQAKVHDFTQKRYQNPNRVEIFPASVNNLAKIKVAKEAYRAIQDSGIKVKQANVDYFDTDQRVTICNSNGLLTEDRRVTSRLRLQATVQDGQQSLFDWKDYVLPHGFETFRLTANYTDFAKQFVKNILKRLRAKSAPTGVFPVVFESGSCGTFWHEACGHQLESTAIAGQRSDFVDLIGKKVASDKVTIIDDGTIPGLYGSAAIDDEGHPTQKNILIENGILTGYLCDRLGGRRLGLPSTGSGRRQSYTYAPVARMTNTYLAAGTDDDDEMIKSVDEGLYVKGMGGGTGGREFSVEVIDGYWIKNGQIDYQIKGLTLNARGIDIMKKVDRVGKRLETEYGGFCGAASGLCPVTSFQPRMRVTEMAIGGGSHG